MQERLTVALIQTELRPRWGNSSAFCRRKTETARSGCCICSEYFDRDVQGLTEV